MGTRYGSPFFGTKFVLLGPVMWTEMITLNLDSWVWKMVKFNGRFYCQIEHVMSATLNLASYLTVEMMLCDL